MPRGKKRNYLGSLTLEGRRVRLKLKNESPEEKAERKIKAKLYYYKRMQNETVEQREHRLAKVRQKNSISEQRRKRKLQRERNQKKLEVATRALNQEPKKVRKPRQPRKDVLHVVDSQLVEVKLEVDVELEPSIEMEATGLIDEPVHEIIEFGDEFKHEFVSENLVVKVDPDSLLSTTPLAYAAQQQQSEALGMKVKVFSDTTTPHNEIAKSRQSPVATTTRRFSRSIPLETKDQAIRYIKLLEEFALRKENFRLIGFTERLQHLIEKGR